MNWYPLLLFAHVVAVVVWVGGMFFAHQCLRPAAAQLLEAPQRLQLWNDVFARFFLWVWAAVVLIPASGLSIIATIGWSAAPLRWHLMLLVGLVMIAIFLIVFFSPYRRLQRSVRAQDWKAGAAALARIRHLVGVNIVLGLATIAIATAGRLFA
ncbi:MAG TPA: CopD family protein [Burkholderiaceae bacterium]|nr:CopD family protein [Burkholderiaceae bacterium]